MFVVCDAGIIFGIQLLKFNCQFFLQGSAFGIARFFFNLSDEALLSFALHEGFEAIGLDRWQIFFGFWLILRSLRR